jgi:hypothetical protein
MGKILLRSLHALTTLVLLALLVLLGRGAAADENDEIVTGCHYSNAEWGSEAIDRCIKENQATRAIVLNYPVHYQRIVNRCRLTNEFGWSWVQTCVDRDIEAEAALAQYSSDQGKLIEQCGAEFGDLGAARVKACVDKQIGAPNVPKSN